MESIGAYEAKTNLARLLEDVATEGRTFLITKHGVPVARLEPVRPHAKHPRDVIAELRQAREGVVLGGDSIRSLIEEGRY